MKNCACADCNRSNVDPSEWTVANYIVGLSNGKHYAMCGGCYEVSQFQDKTENYYEWLGRSGKTEHIKVDNICVTCLMEEKPRLTRATEVHEGIPVCKGCKSFFELQDTYLWGIEHHWVDELYEDAKRKMKQGLTVEVAVYK